MRARQKGNVCCTAYYKRRRVKCTAESQLAIYDTYVCSVMNYVLCGGFQSGAHVEKVRTDLFKYILKVRKTTLDNMLYF